MRSIGTIAASIVARAAASQRAQYQAAHEAAAAFHEAIADAMGCETDLADLKAMGLTAATDSDVARLEKRYPEALGRAAAALLKMPVRWAAVLETELDAVKSNVVAMQRAAE